MREVYTFVGFVFVFLVFSVGASALTQVLQLFPLRRRSSPSCNAVFKYFFKFLFFK